jgi:hypothetical protein
MAQVCALIGTAMIARAVDDPKLSEALCAATLAHLGGRKV